MSAAPANGINFYVVFKGLEENSVVPADGSISSAKIASGAVSSSKLDTNIAISGSLTASGNVGVNGGTGGQVAVNYTTASTTGLKLNDTNSGNLGGYVDFRSGSGAGTQRATIQNANNAGIHVNVGTGGSLSFGTGYTAASALDDYEVGTWTPSTNIGFNSITDASYVKVGKLVFVNLSAQTNTGPGDVSQATSVSGLPFACRTGNAVSNSVIIEGLNQDVYAEIAGNSYSQIDKDNGTPITRGEFGQQRNCRVTLVYSIA